MGMLIRRRIKRQQETLSAAIKRQRRWKDAAVTKTRKTGSLVEQRPNFQSGNLWFLAEFSGVLCSWASVACGSGFLWLLFIASWEASPEQAKVQVFAATRLSWWKFFLNIRFMDIVMLIKVWDVYVWKVILKAKIKWILHWVVPIFHICLL